MGILVDTLLLLILGLDSAYVTLVCKGARLVIVLCHCLLAAPICISKVTMLSIYLIPFYGTTFTNDFI